MTHGGDIYSNSVKYDFSVSLNPLGCPEEVQRAAIDGVRNISHYPDIAQRALKSALSGYVGAGEDEIVCANGASELFVAIADMIRPRRAMIPAPGFSGYERALGVSGECMITEYPVLEGVAPKINDDTDIVFLCDPNNPTGTLTDETVLKETVKDCAKRDIWLVVDECFIELSRGAVSVKDMCREHPRLIVVRAFTKLFAMPGIRFGYGMMCSDTANKLASYLPEWNVSVVAEAAAIEAVRIATKTDFIESSLRLIDSEKSYIVDSFNNLGFKVFHSDTCFVMFYTDKEIYDGLLEQGILIRDCSGFSGLTKGYYRVGIRSHRENVILIEALKRLCIQR